MKLSAILPGIFAIRYGGIFAVTCENFDQETIVGHAGAAPAANSWIGAGVCLLCGLRLLFRRNQADDEYPGNGWVVIFYDAFKRAPTYASFVICRSCHTPNPRYHQYALLKEWEAAA